MSTGSLADGPASRLTRLRAACLTTATAGTAWGREVGDLLTRMARIDLHRDALVAEEREIADRLATLLARRNQNYLDEHAHREHDHDRRESDCA
jgi:hypothetical protein